jgi:ribonuclease P protein component
VERLRGPKQFTEVFAQGRRFVVGHAAVIVRPTTGPARWGIVVGKRVGKAVVRNRVKRRLREICRTAEAAMRGGGDIVVVARPGAAAADYDALLHAVLSALRRAHLVSDADIGEVRVCGAPSEAGPRADPR